MVCLYSIGNYREPKYSCSYLGKEERFWLNAWYSLRSVDCCTLWLFRTSSSPPRSMSLRTHCHLQVLSVQDLVSSRAYVIWLQHVYICGKTPKEILMQISIVFPLFSSLFWLTWIFMCLLLPADPKRHFGLLYLWITKPSVNCSRSTYPTTPPLPHPDHHHTHTHTQHEWVRSSSYSGSHLSRITKPWSSCCLNVWK